MLVLKKCLFGLTTVVTIIHITAADNYSESSLGYVSGINTSNEENKKFTNFPLVRRQSYADLSSFNTNNTDDHQDQYFDSDSLASSESESSEEYNDSEDGDEDQLGDRSNFEQFNFTSFSRQDSSSNLSQTNTSDSDSLRSEEYDGLEDDQEDVLPDVIPIQSLENCLSKFPLSLVKEYLNKPGNELVKQKLDSKLERHWLDRVRLLTIPEFKKESVNNKSFEAGVFKKNQFSDLDRLQACESLKRKNFDFLNQLKTFKNATLSLSD